MGGKEGGRDEGVVSFNWATGSETCSDNIKGQIYIRHCWEMSTYVRKGHEEARGDAERL